MGLFPSLKRLIRYRERQGIFNFPPLPLDVGARGLVVVVVVGGLGGGGVLEIASLIYFISDLLCSFIKTA